jgi:AcrR family transcriptional regulator
MEAKETRKQQKEKTRSSLIQVATDLFAENGIATTSTAAIAKALNVSHGTVFIHFPTREDLVLAVLDAFGTRLGEELKNAVSNASDLRAILTAHLAVLAEFEDFYFRLITEINALPSNVKGLLIAMNSAVSYYLFNAAKVGMRDGKVRNFEQHMLFNTWLALVNYYVSNRDLLSEKKPILREKEAELVNHFIKLIKVN